MGENEQVPTLWEHQMKALKRALEQKRFALFMEMGTGKTAVAVHFIRKSLKETTND